MYHYLRTQNGKQIVDIEPFIRDNHFIFIGGVCNIKQFLNFYDSIPANLKKDFKKDFDDINEMKAWFFDQYLPIELKQVVSYANLDKTHAEIEKFLIKIAKKYNLVYGKD